MTHRLLFVCSGNLCRSPMAAYLAREAAERADLQVEVQSAGTLGIVGEPPPGNAVAVMLEVDIILDDHRSQALTPELIDWADQVLVMTYAHASAVRELVPDVGERVTLLGAYGSLAPEIADPMGRWRPFYRRVREHISSAVDGLIARLEREG